VQKIDKEKMRKELEKAKKEIEKSREQIKEELQKKRDEKNAALNTIPYDLGTEGPIII
jgi:phenylalanyl-tRNA synthetase alpha subunit